MDIKQRTEALLLAANRALTIKDIGELLEAESSEDESQVINAVTSLKEEYNCLLYTSPSPRDRG